VILWVLLGVAEAAPTRAPLPKAQEIIPGPDKRLDLLYVKLVEDAGLVFDEGEVRGSGRLDLLNRLLGDAKPMFHRPAHLLREDSRVYDPEGALADLSLWLQVAHPDAVSLGNRLLLEPLVETVELASWPLPPPGDIPPTTPDFTDYQAYLQPAPDGFGVDEAARWPGGTGEHVAVADVEYGWEQGHEDLSALDDPLEVGWLSFSYVSHGNAVVGEIAGDANGYGISGMAPDVEMVMVSPYIGRDVYNVAVAINDAAAVLDAGDVILIEQQAWAFDNYAPVEVTAAVFDAITLAVAKGIVVVEPTGNGGQDLDSPKWAGWFDRTERDSGAIMVGGGASPFSGMVPRSWYPYGSSYGSRVDVQGWFDSITTTYTDEYGSAGANLFFPGGDSRQAYTSNFGGTSGASPQVTACAAVANSVAWALWGHPWDPIDLRDALVQTGTPQPAADTARIGPQPDLRVFLRTWGVR